MHRPYPAPWVYRPGRNACQARNALAQRFQLDHARLHFTQLAGHGIQVLPHEAVALVKFILHHQPHQGADHGPAFARTFEKHQVVEGPPRTSAPGTLPEPPPPGAPVNWNVRQRVSRESMIISCILDFLSFPSTHAPPPPRRHSAASRRRIAHAGETDGAHAGIERTAPGGGI